MSENIETQESVVSEPVSSEPHSSPAKETRVETSSESKSSQPEKYVPYERFQEIIQQKNEFLKRIEDNEKRYQELHNKFNEANKPKAEPSKEQSLIARLKGIDPEFGTWAEQQNSLQQKLAELEQYKQQADQERLKTQVDSAVEKLYTDHKIPVEAKEIYNALLRQTAMNIERNGKTLGVQDIPAVFKQVHDNLSKYLETQKRTEIASYATSKKADSSTPATKKGTQVKTEPKKFNFSKDPEEARSQIVKRALEQHRSEKNST